ncbi:hypothetical protein BMS3Abin03_02332 [bacterium BMS3Abin03]|nr:hypothetical protein BMS3Abin03_02332 [bacterium BMS3Abin03]
MNLKKIFGLTLISGLILIISSCDLKRPAKGFEDEIYVVADSVEFAQLKSALDSTFEKTIYTPQPEKLFTLKRINVSRLDHYERFKNIIIVAPLNSGSSTSNFIDAVVDTAIKRKLQTDANFIVYKNNLWAKNQLVIVLSAPTMQELEFKILQNSDKLLYSFQKISDKRLFESLYNPKFEKMKIEGKFLKEYGWTIYVQADYELALDKPADNFVWLRRSPGSDMERWIFIHWIDNATPEYLNIDSIKAIRNRVTEKFYRTSDNEGYVVIAKDYFTTNEVNFNGKYAIFTQGLWDLNIKGMGGPFVNYTFYDKDTRRLYMLDGSIFAPKYYKRNLIQQVDVTLQSFRTAKELSADRKEDLLDAVKD